MFNNLTGKYDLFLELYNRLGVQTQTITADDFNLWIETLKQHRAGTRGGHGEEPARGLRAHGYCPFRVLEC